MNSGVSSYSNNMVIFGDRAKAGQIPGKSQVDMLKCLMSMLTVVSELGS